MNSATRFSISRQILGFALWLGAVAIMGFFGGLASIKAVDFYQALSRPSWAPPASVFGPVWTLLYLLMAVAAWLVWKDYGFRRSGAALWFFLIQMVLNALWTWLFFHWKNGALAFAEILALWLLILVTLTAFWRLRTPAGALLLPYLAWVTFATFLTYSVWKQNPTLLG